MLLVSVVFIKLTEMVGPKLKAFMAPATPSEKEEVQVTDHFLLRGKIPGGAFTLLFSFPLRDIWPFECSTAHYTAKFERLWVAPIF